MQSETLLRCQKMRDGQRCEKTTGHVTCHVAGKLAWYDEGSAAHSASTLKYRDPGEPASECPSCVAWSAEVQRVSLLLERLAEDRFPDQATFDKWINDQMRQVFNGRK